MPSSKNANHMLLFFLCTRAFIGGGTDSPQMAKKAPGLCQSQALASSALSEALARGTVFHELHESVAQHLSRTSLVTRSACPVPQNLTQGKKSPQSLVGTVNEISNYPCLDGSRLFVSNWGGTFWI